MPIIKTKIEKYDNNLKGVVLYNNKEYALDNLIKGEEVEIEIIHEGKNQTIGKLIKIIKR